MKIIKLWRTFKEGAENFRRNGWLTFATVSVLTLSLFVMSLTALIGIAGHYALKNLEEKISVSVSFNPGVSEARILSIKDDLEKYREISSIRYVSREDSLTEFMSDGNAVISEAIKEIGENPLLSSLVIKAVDPRDYDLIASQIQGSSFKDEIARVNYERNKRQIEGLNNLTDKAKKSGIALGVLFTVIAVLITFNTVRLTIYSHRQEFEVMRLVGASDLYIKMPFFFEGVFYGLTAAVITLASLTGAAYWISQGMGDFFSGVLNGGTFFSLYGGFLWALIPSTVLLSILLGVASSFIAIRRYLRI